jgi:hypothetical protein
VVYGCQVLGYLLKVFVPTRDTRKSNCMSYMLGGQELSLMSPIAVVNKNIYDLDYFLHEMRAKI